VSSACSPVAVDQCGAHLWIAFGWLELAGHAGKEAGEHQLLFDSNHRVVRPRHPDVRLVGGAAGKHALIGGWDVGVSPKQRSYAAVEIPAHCDLLAGGFAMQIEQNDLRGDSAEQFVRFAEGVIATGHEDAALQIDHGVTLAIAERTFIETEAGRAGSVVGGAQDAAATRVRVRGDGHVFKDLALVPDVVACGDHVGAEIEELFRNRGGDAKAAGGVLSVDDQEIDIVGFEDVGKVFADDMAAGGAKDVADEKNIHSRILHAGDGGGWRAGIALGRVSAAFATAQVHGVVAFWHGTEWAFPVKCAGVGGAGQ
jgi:hypothetical protein